MIGDNAGACTPERADAAYRAGAEVARAGAVLVTGGLGGAMEAASRGASEAGGLVVGIIPQDDASAANGFCDVVVPTGIGLARDYVNALAADAVVVVGGGAGTLSEACAAYMHGRPIVALRGAGGSVGPYVDGYLDHRRSVRIAGADTPEEAVRAALGMALYHGP